MKRPLLKLFTAIAVCACAARQSLALDVDEFQWGFDGHVVVDCFNPLSVLVSNRSATAFDGEMILSQIAGADRVGAQIVEPIYLSPNASRWVQFYPYIKHGSENWSLRSSARQQFDVPDPSPGERAAILLSDPDEFAAAGTYVKRFSDNLFPPMVGATDGLKAVVLDHVPRWEEARRQAFLDWLHKGGIVHLMHAASGQFPEFPPALSVLNQPLPSYRVGSGMVVRHARPTRDLSKAFVDETIAPDRWTRSAVLGDEAAAKLRAGDSQEAAKNANNFPQYQNYQDMVFDDVDNSMFGELNQMTRPKHKWGFIYILSLLYIGLIFPGFYLLGLKRSDYRVMYGAMLVVVMIFSGLFAFIGRRGYDETTTVHTVSIATPLADGSLDVTGWTNAFVTGGDNYVISNDGTGKLFSTAQELERVNGEISNGSGGRFVVDIPPFSNRAFAFRTRLPGGIAPTIKEFKGGDKLQNLVVEFGSTPPVPNDSQALALYKDVFYPASFIGDKVTVYEGGSSTMPDLINRAKQGGFGGFNSVFRGWGDERAVADRYRELFTPLVVRSFHERRVSKVSEFALSPDRVRLFVYARIPESMGTRLSRLDEPEAALGKQAGVVLYVFDVFLGEKS